MRRSISFSLLAAAAAVSVGAAVAVERTGAGTVVPALAAAISPLRINGVVGPCLCPTCMGMRAGIDDLSAFSAPTQHISDVAAV